MFTKRLIRNIIKELDTQTAVKVSIIAFGDSTLGEVMVTMGPAQFATQSGIETAVAGITVYGSTTAAAGGIDEAVNQLDTTDNVNDVMIVVTDGFDRQQVQVATAAANAASAGITALSVSYEPQYSQSTMEDIANQIQQNIFIGSSSTLPALAGDIVTNICSGQHRAAKIVKKPQPVLHRFVYEAASLFIDKFQKPPSWLPQYHLWREGQIVGFTGKRKPTTKPRKKPRRP